MGMRLVFIDGALYGNSHVRGLLTLQPSSASAGFLTTAPDLTCVCIAWDLHSLVILGRVVSYGFKLGLGKKRHALEAISGAY